MDGTNDPDSTKDPDGTKDGATRRRSDPARRGVTQVNKQGGGQSQGATRRGSTSRPASKPASSGRPPARAGAGGGRGGSGGGGGGRGGKGAGNTGVPNAGQRRSPAVWGWGAGALVVVAVLVIALVAVTNKPKNTSTVSNVASSLVHLVTDVPPSVLDQVGIDGNTIATQAAANPVNLIKTKHASGNGLPDEGGKPVVFYFGALYCPYCATERWGIIVALSRFGTFTNLAGAVSSSTDVYPSTETWSFHGASYSSPYIVFKPVEFEDENQNLLDPLTAAEKQVLSIWDPPESFPFLTIGTTYTGGLPGWMNPQLLQSLSRQQIAETLAEPTNPLGGEVDANANYLSAAICGVDGRQPASVCSSAGVQAAVKQMKKLPAAVPVSTS